MIVIYSEYGKLSSMVYDITKPIGYSINGDIEYYTERLKNVSGEILEAGVGTGRMLIPMLQKGFNISGLDYSKDILDVCNLNLKKYNLSTKLIHMDLLDLDTINKFGAIIMPTGSFCLITDRTSSIKILENFYNSLNKGGVLILDLIYPNDFKEGDIQNNIFELVDKGITMTYKSLEIDWINQITKSILVYEYWSKGNLLDTELQNYDVRWYGIHEFESILKDVGFTNISFSSNYVFKNSNLQNSDIITVEATKG